MITPTKISAAAFETFINLPENLERRLELIYGEIVEKMTTHVHGIIVARFIFFIEQYLQEFPIGFAAAEPRFKPTPDSEHDLIPDGAFTIESRGVVYEGAMSGVPDIAIEVQSPGQSEEFRRKKAQIYLTYGTAIVWLVFPKKRTVAVLTATTSETLTENDVLDGGDVLPHFQLPIEKIFARL